MGFIGSFLDTNTDIAREKSRKRFAEQRLPWQRLYSLANCSREDIPVSREHPEQRFSPFPRCRLEWTSEFIERTIPSRICAGAHALRHLRQRDAACCCQYAIPDDGSKTLRSSFTFSSTVLPIPFHASALRAESTPLFESKSTIPGSRKIQFQ